MCLSGASTTVQGPGAIQRGGSLFSQSDAGPFWIDATTLPSDSANFQGFRGARQSSSAFGSLIFAARTAAGTLRGVPLLRP